MNNFIVDSATVIISEQTLKELLQVVREERAKAREFKNEPMPEGDMDNKTFRKLERERGRVIVSSPYCDLKFKILIEIEPHTQESAGYKIEELR